MSAVLRCEGVGVRYGEVVALEGVDLEVTGGAVTALLGPNGAGKSSLLSAILGVTPHAGTIGIRVGGAPAGRRDVAWVPQRTSIDADFPVSLHEIALQGVMVGRSAWSWPSRADHVAADAALDRVGMLPLRDRLLGEVSGGQRQRALVARALAQTARVYLLDEPFAGIDAPSEAAIFAVLRELATDDALVLLVHHDLGAVLRGCDRAVLINRRVVAEGPVEQVLDATTIARAYGGVLSATFADPRATA